MKNVLPTVLVSVCSSLSASCSIQFEGKDNGVSSCVQAFLSSSSFISILSSLPLNCDTVRVTLSHALGQGASPWQGSKENLSRH